MAIPHPSIPINGRMTADDLAHMPDDGNRYELIEGELFVSAAPTMYHQRAVVWLGHQLIMVGEMTGQGAVFTAPAQVRLDPWTVVEPDVFFVVRDREHVINWSRGVDGSPDLVIEVVSPTNADHDTIRKMALYSIHRVQEYWLFDPMARTVSTYRHDGERYVSVQPNADGRIVSRVVDGFSINPDAFFAMVYRGMGPVGDL